MYKLSNFINKNFTTIVLFLLGLILISSYSNPNKITNKKIDALSAKIDSLQKTTVTRKDLQLEGLKTEKRMIQSTDRKMLDVQRQSVIDEEISKLQN